MKKPVKITVITVLVLVGALVGADYGLAAAAEYQVSKKMRTELNLASDPSVDIHGFPFITQAIAGDYHDVAIDAVGVPVNSQLRDLEIAADLHDVRVKLSELLGGNVQQIKVAEVDGQVKVKSTDIGRLLHIPDLSINPISLDTVLGTGAQDAEDQKDHLQDPGGSSSGSGSDSLATKAGVEMSGTIDLAGEQTKVNAFGVMSLSGGAVIITPKKLQLTNGLVSGDIPDSLLQGFTHLFQVRLSSSNLPLPFTIRATGVDVQNGAIVVGGTANNIVLSADSVNP
ncbi:MAG TPA: LmeA family phospholipid-binding protein [Pseudonocardiaceae bacterium]|nr:LmeA family phospholipid-binding protein [Pseudonocardiaceae bacterium]